MPRTDYHAHLIPGIDDGSRTRAETLIMARGLADLGVETLHLTPHQFRFGNDLEPDEIRAKTAEIQGWLDEAGIALALRASAEHLYGERLVDAVTSGEELLTWSEPDGDGGLRACLLVELPLRDPVVGVGALADACSARGIVPVMAHPERVILVQDDPGRVTRWAEHGWRFQLDLLSLAVGYGRTAKHVARRLLKDSQASVSQARLAHEFTTSSRFAQQYKRLFGELPSHTIGNRA